MRKSQNFRDKNAGRYDRFMRRDAAAYAQLYELLRPVARQKTGLKASFPLTYAECVKTEEI